MEIAFGPIPSRRLGRSLGINHVPAKTCSYACVYCQVGRTTRMSIERQVFFEPQLVFEEVTRKIALVEKAGESIDYLSFVPDGEPTLDANLGKTIDLLRRLDRKIAVITNSSLVWREDVRADLSLADWVSLKVDGVRRETWSKVGRPHPALDLDAILAGIGDFAAAFRGKLVTETMLVRGYNDSAGDLEALAGFLEGLRPAMACLSVPTRPPALTGVRAPDEAALHLAYRTLRAHLESVELLIGYEGDAFASTGDPAGDVLSITAVHPMREQAVRDLLRRAGSGWEVIERLLDEGRLVRQDFEGDTFYMRKLPSRKPAGP
jgi:wyosine [tRNA(Phe)-imidazoG37] synthetase (radical SAM superfamily)